jgi:hypothetical protein
VGGAKNDYKVLADSSLDWGQDLKGLKQWMDENGVKKIQLGYFGTADPNYYGIDAHYLPGSVMYYQRRNEDSPPFPKHVAVSVTHIYGIYFGKALRGIYGALRERQPIATIGYSIFVYRLD